MGDPRFVDLIGGVSRRTFIDGDVTPTSVGTVVDRIKATVGGQNEIVGISKAGGVHLNRSTRDKLSLILAVISTKRIVGVIHSWSVFVVQSREVVSGVAYRVQIDRQNGR